MPNDPEPPDSSRDEAIPSESSSPREKGRAKYFNETSEWIKKNPSTPVAILALIVSILAFTQSHRSADIASTQLMLASRPLLYGKCDFARSDFLKLSPVPDALMIAQPKSPTPPLHIQTLTKTLPAVPPYEKVLPWIVNRCSITNTGRGTAQGIEFEITTMFVDRKIQTPTSQKVSQLVQIDLLTPGSTYDFIVANLRDDIALVLMPQTVRYDVGLTGEHASEPLIHGPSWNQLTLDDRQKPKSLKPGE